MFWVFCRWIWLLRWRRDIKRGRRQPQAGLQRRPDQPRGRFRRRPDGQEDVYRTNHELSAGRPHRRGAQGRGEVHSRNHRLNSQITEETQQAHRSEERWAVFDGGFIILTRGFEAGIVSFALCTQGIDTLKTQAFPVNGKSVIRGDDPVFNAPPVFLPVIPVFVAARANTGLGLTERAAVFLAGTPIIGGLAILVHSQPGRAD